MSTEPRKTLPLVISLDEIGVRLRGAETEDLETLRIWKNANRDAFFDQREITPEQETAWFASYLMRPDDRMYFVEERAGANWVSFGVLGARRLGGTVDIYNVMRGPEATVGRGKLGKALLRLCELASHRYRLPVTCKVLLGNPARTFYERTGFVIIASDHGYHHMMWEPR